MKSNIDMCTEGDWHTKPFPDNRRIGEHVLARPGEVRLEDKRDKCVAGCCPKGPEGPQASCIAEFVSALPCVRFTRIGLQILTGDLSCTVMSSMAKSHIELELVDRLKEIAQRGDQR